jgi:hypothetical protein
LVVSSLQVPRICSFWFLDFSSQSHLSQDKHGRTSQIEKG